ncbi:MAG: MFS transporter [Pseudomonadales bacterium]
MIDKHYRWIIVAYTLVIQAVSIGILIYCFALFVVPWLDTFNAPRRDVMLPISILQVVVGLASPLVGRAMDRYPLRNLVLAGLALLLAGLFLASRATALWQIVLVYATLFPVSMALMGTLAAQTLVTRWFPTRRGVAIGISATGTNLGGVVFPLIVAGWLTDVGWRETMLWLGAVSVVLVGPLTWLVLRREPPGMRPAPGVAPATQRMWTTREILSTRLFWIPGIAIVPLSLAFGAVQYNLGTLSRDIGMSTDAAANLIALNAVCMILGKFFFGGVGDRLDHRYIFWMASILMAISLITLQGATDVSTLVTGVVFMGLAGGGMLPFFGVVFGSRFGSVSFGRVMGFAMLTMTLGSLGPLLAGWTYDLTGSYDLAFQGFASLLLPAAIVMVWLPGPEPEMVVAVD